MRRAAKVKRGKIKPAPYVPPVTSTSIAPSLDFGGSASVLLNLSGWRGLLPWALSYLIGHALFIGLVRLFCPERDAKGIFIGAPESMHVCGNYAMFRTNYCIAVYGALTDAQRRVFVSGVIRVGL